jgi:predicted DNA-binding transcriptional regulator YafY
MRRAERLFQIVQVIGASQWTTAQALAERLQVSERTIYRDVDHLSASGVPLYSQAGKGYALLEGYQLPPLMFSVEEWQALLTGLSMAQGWAGQRQAEALRAVQEKLAMAVPSHLRALASPVSAPALPERRMLGALLDPLQRAIRERSKVRVFRSSSANGLSGRWGCISGATAGPWWAGVNCAKRFAISGWTVS